MKIVATLELNLFGASGTFQNDEASASQWTSAPTSRRRARTETLRPSIFTISPSSRSHANVHGLFSAVLIWTVKPLHGCRLPSRKTLSSRRRRPSASTCRPAVAEPAMALGARPEMRRADEFRSDAAAHPSEIVVRDVHAAEAQRRVIRPLEAILSPPDCAVVPFWESYPFGSSSPSRSSSHASPVDAPRRRRVAVR